MPSDFRGKRRQQLTLLLLAVLPSAREIAGSARRWLALLCRSYRYTAWNLSRPAIGGYRVKKRCFFSSYKRCLTLLRESKREYTELMNYSRAFCLLDRFLTGGIFIDLGLFFVCKFIDLTPSLFTGHNFEMYIFNVSRSQSPCVHNYIRMKVGQYMPSLQSWFNFRRLQNVLLPSEMIW